MAQEQQQKAGGTEQEQQTQQTEEGGAKATGLERAETPPAQAQAIERPERHALGRPELWTSPFTFMQRMIDEMDRVFSRFGGLGPSLLAGPSVFAPLREEGVWSPVIETFERDGQLVLRAELPGLERKDVKVEVIGDELVISGQRKHVERQKSEGRYYSERRYGSFERRMTLPENCAPESIEASFDNGVLEVSVAIPEEKPKIRTIEVRSGQGTSEGGPRSVH